MRSSASNDRQVTIFEVEVLSDTARLLTEAQAPLWDATTTEQREALVGLVTSALGHMQRNVSEWLPTALEARSHTRFGIVISWETGMLDEEILRRQLTAEETRRERVADLLRMSQTTSE